MRDPRIAPREGDVVTDGRVDAHASMLHSHGLITVKTAAANDVAARVMIIHIDDWRAGCADPAVGVLRWAEELDDIGEGSVLRWTPLDKETNECS